MEFMQNKIRVAFVSGGEENRSLAAAVPESTKPKAVELQFFEMPLQDGVDPLSRSSDLIRAYNPDIIFIGQTPYAENLLRRLRLAASPLIVRWSIFYGIEKSQSTNRVASEVGYHLDMPKTKDSLLSFIKNEQLLNSIKHKQVKSILRSLPGAAKVFPSFHRWADGGSTPPLDIPITDFMYLDDEGIHQLFVQTGKQYLESVVHKRDHTTSGKASGTLKVGKILELFGIGGAEGAGAFDVGKTFSQEFTEKLDTVGKLKIVMDALSTRRSLYFVDSDFDSPNRLAEIKMASFVDFWAWFHTQEDAIRVTASVAPQEEFMQFRCTNMPVTLGASMSKFKLGLHHVRNLLGVGESRLKVFAKITPAESSYYLKPFAFWVTHARVPKGRGDITS